MKQINIIAPNRGNPLVDIIETLATANVNIESLDAETAGNYIVAVLSVDQYDLALQSLRRLSDLHMVTEDAILLKLPNEPGALAKIARRFTDAGLALRSMRFIQHDEHFALVAISTDRTDAALALVEDVLVFR